MILYKTARLDDSKGDLNKQWFVYYSFKHPETGQFQRFKKYISNKHKTKAARFEKASEIIKQLNNWLKAGGNPFQTTAQFTRMIQAIDYVYEIKKASLRPRSYSSYNTVMKKFKTWLNKYHSNMILEEFGFYHAQKFMDWLVINEKLKNRTYNNHVTYMRIFFNTLIEREYIVINPFMKIKLFPKTEAEVRNFTPEEMLTIRSNMPFDNRGLWIACQFIYYCFIRPAELVRIKISDINLAKKELYIRPEVSKNRKGATILIPEAFLPELYKLHMYHYNNEFYLFSHNLSPGSNLLYHNSLSKAWRVWADEYGVKKDLYDFKHTGVGMALDSGININDLRMQLRHSSLQMTQIYLEKFRAMPGEKLRKDFPVF